MGDIQGNFWKEESGRNSMYVVSAKMNKHTRCNLILVKFIKFLITLISAISLSLSGQCAFTNFTVCMVSVIVVEIL